MKYNFKYYLVNQHHSCNDLIVYLLVVMYRPCREFFMRIETAPLTVKGCKSCLPLYHTNGDTGPRIIRLIRRTTKFYICGQAFCRGTVTTCLNGLGPFRPGFELRSPACDAYALLLIHRRSS